MIGTGDEHMEADPDLFLERYAEWVKNFGVTFSEAMLPIIKASIPIGFEMTQGGTGGLDTPPHPIKTARTKRTKTMLFCRMPSPDMQHQRP